MINKQNALAAVDEVTAQVLSAMEEDIGRTIDQHIATHLSQVDIDQKVENSIGHFLTYLVEQNNKQQILNRFAEKTDVLVGMLLAEVQLKVQKQVEQTVADLIANANLDEIIRQAATSVVNQSGRAWGDKTIPASAVNFESASVSAAVLHGGIAHNFASEGLADYAKSTVVTLLNERVAVGTNLIVDGDLVVTGAISTDTPYFENLSKQIEVAVGNNVAGIVNDTIAQSVIPNLMNGIDAESVTVRNEALVKDSKLNRYVTDSNLQKVGRLRELDVGGEVSLNDSLYVGRRRVGINTMEPQSALDIWDQEVEIIAEKSEANTGYIGLGKTGMLRIGVDRRAALTILPNADVEIPGLRIGRYEKVSLAVSGGIPTGPGTTGDIIFNNNPESNGVFAWVCLEGTRWAPVRLDI